MEQTNWIVGLFNKIWQSLAEEKDRGYIYGAGFTSGAYSPHIFGFSVGVWSPVVNGLGGLIYIGMGAVVAKIFLKIYYKKIVPKIKFLSDDKEKESDNERAA